MKIGSIIKKILIIGIIAYGINTCISQQKLLNTYTYNSRTLDEQIAKAEKYQSELNDIKNNVSSHEYIEQVAREKLDMYRPNERVYVDNSN